MLRDRGREYYMSGTLSAAMADFAVRGRPGSPSPCARRSADCVPAPDAPLVRAAHQLCAEDADLGGECYTRLGVCELLLGRFFAAVMHFTNATLSAVLRPIDKTFLDALLLRDLARFMHRHLDSPIQQYDGATVHGGSAVSGACF